MEETVLSAQGLKKSYRKLTAVNGLSFKIQKGSVFGLLGPNGSGKSTTLGMLMGVLAPDAGTFQWFGEGNGPTQRRKIGTLIEGANFYNYLSAYNNLRINAAIKEVPLSEIERVLKKVDLWERKDSRFRTFSTGMKQRLGIANAMLGNPQMLILDEPTNGLDPQGIADVRQIIKQEAEAGQTILLASHLLDEVEKVCTHMVVLQKGNLLFDGEVTAFLKDKRRIELAADDMTALRTALEGYAGIEKIIQNEKSLTIQIKDEFDSKELNKYLFEKGIVLTHFAAEQHALETQFLELTSKK